MTDLVHNFTFYAQEGFTYKVRTISGDEVTLDLRLSQVRPGKKEVILVEKGGGSPEVADLHEYLENIAYASALAAYKVYIPNSPNGFSECQEIILDSASGVLKFSYLTDRVDILDHPEGINARQLLEYLDELKEADMYPTGLRTVAQGYVTDNQRPAFFKTLGEY